ncbi:MAG: hypothetical protein ACR2M1_05630 [Gemmatimonadaceae bacterium]
MEADHIVYEAVTRTGAVYWFARDCNGALWCTAAARIPAASAVPRGVEWPVARPWPPIPESGRVIVAAREAVGPEQIPG